MADKKDEQSSPNVTSLPLRVKLRPPSSILLARLKSLSQRGFSSGTGSVGFSGSTAVQLPSGSGLSLKLSFGAVRELTGDFPGLAMKLEPEALFQQHLHHWSKHHSATRSTSGFALIS